MWSIALFSRDCAASPVTLCTNTRFGSAAAPSMADVACSLHPRLQASLLQDLSLWRNRSISRFAFDSAPRLDSRLQESDVVAAFGIYNNTLHWLYQENRPRNAELYAIVDDLRALLEVHKVPDVEFRVNAGDAPLATRHVPVRPHVEPDGRPAAVEPVARNTGGHAPREQCEQQCDEPCSVLTASLDVCSRCSAEEARCHPGDADYHARVYRQAPRRPTVPLALFSFCKASHFHDVLVPNSGFRGHSFETHLHSRSEAGWEAAFPWRRKLQAAYWRGSGYCCDPGVDCPFGRCSRYTECLAVLSMRLHAY